MKRRLRVHSATLRSGRANAMNFLVYSCAVAAAVLAAVCGGYSSPHRPAQLLGLADDQVLEESAYEPLAIARSDDDQQLAASHDHHLGRVQIKVYRGPTTHHGHEHFAPHGFWVKQPADDHHHHH